jgi:hypothetical protein
MSAVPTAGSKSTQSVSEQRVRILTVDPVGNSATAQTRYTTALTINTQFHVGAVHVTPAVGEIWFVKRVYGGTWVLDRKLTSSDSTLANVVTNPVAGTYQVGSAGIVQGPLNLMGSAVTVMAPLGTQAVATSARPDPTTVPAGTQIYDSTLGKPIWSNGTVWHDSTGASV